jgi:hypothetical protein
MVRQFTAKTVLAQNSEGSRKSREFRATAIISSSLPANMRCFRSLHQNRAQQQLWFHEPRGENLENLGAVRTLPNQKCFRMKGKLLRPALVAPLAEAMPPMLFGGTECVVPGDARPS